MDIQLGEMLEENVTVNLVGSDSTATYGSSNDWTLSVGGTVCTGVANNECQVSITAGQSSVTDDVVITINDDGRTNELPEDIVLSTIPDSGSTHLLQAGSPFTLNIPRDRPFPTVSLSADSTSITEGNTATITLTLSEALGSNATFNLIEGGTGATYGTSNDWNLSVGGNDCGMASQTNPCQVTISGNDTTAEVIVEVRDDMTPEALEEFTVSVGVDSGSTSIVTTGSSSSLRFNIPDHRPTVSLNLSGSNNLQEFASRTMTIELSEMLNQAVTLNIVTDNGTAVNQTDFIVQQRTPSGSGSYSNCTSTTGISCQITIMGGDTNADINFRAIDGVGKKIIAEIQLPQASQNLVALGNPTRRELNIIP